MNDPQSQQPELSPHHYAMLHDESAIAGEVIRERGYRTVRRKEELAQLGFAPSQQRAPGLLLPLWTTDGGNGIYAYRPDNARVVEDRRKKNADGTYPNRVIKYEIPKGVGVRLDCPPRCRPLLGDPGTRLWIVEGQKKADALASHGQCAVALLGVWNFKGQNEFGATTFLADWDYIALKGRDAVILFDSDLRSNRHVRQALERLKEHLQRKEARVGVVYLPPGEGGRKVGADDWLAAGGTIEELERLVEAPRPEPKAAPPRIELLDEQPVAIRRPLSLVDGRAYAAAWLHVKVTRSESLNKKGEIVRHDPPLTTNEQRLFIVRDDGHIFGDGGDKPLEELGIAIRLSEIPPPGKTLSASGVLRYHRGELVAPAEVFSQVVDVVDRFIDFDRSLAGQRTMAEMIALYILATYFLDAFNVVGFLWPNGDRGSGKSQLLIVIAEIAYLGQVVLAGGSFASLRDLADYGATLAFDDAENLSDPRKTDPDKRTLLLAGNRRGNTVPVKELAADKVWRTRHVNTFCPRLFSATRLPDPILASRAIVVPLIRTPDRFRANADPLDFSLWPHDRRQLIDSLWTLALRHLPELPAYDGQVAERASLSGRNLEPWRATLAMAAWLDDEGVSGLWDRMNALSVTYQGERPELEPGDLTALVIRALCELARRKARQKATITTVTTVCTVKKEIPEMLFITSEITETAIALIERDELDFNPDFITSRRLGRCLGQMRLAQEREPSGKRRRGWRVTWADLERWTTTYAISLPEMLGLKSDDNTTNGPLPTNGTNGRNGTNGQNIQTSTTDDDLNFYEGTI